LLVGCRQSTVHEFTILHINDFHDRLLPDPDGIGGAAHLATVLKRERAAAHASITLNAGDLVEGTPISTMFEGVPDYEIANNLGIDVNCLGNHEFDYGWMKIREFMRIARRLVGLDTEAVRETGGGFFARLGRALGLSSATAA